MRLTRYTDYALRVMIHLAARPGRSCSIAEIARAHGVSENHLMKVVYDLGRAGFLKTTRGRGGGVRLARPALEVSVGEVVRRTEGDCELAHCEGCVSAQHCGLSGLFGEARRSFFAVLDACTVAQLAAIEQTKLLERGAA